MKTILLIFLCFLSAMVFGQDHKQEIEHESIKRSRIAAFTGNTLVPGGVVQYGKTLIIPTIGVDYEFALSHKFVVGLSNELELTNYIVESGKGDQFIRQYAYSINFLGFYEPIKNLAFFVGGGREFEKNHNFWTMKVGTSYSFKLQNDWDITPSLTYHNKEEFSVITMGFSFGKRF